VGIPDLLAELLLAPGASGYEGPVQAIVRREAEAIGAEVATDVLGTTIATVKGTAGGRTIALFAHADQIAMSVRDAGGDGLLTVAQLANWRSGDARGQRVRIVTATGEVRGVVAAPHEGEISWDLLRVDIGATDREEALGLVRPGDPIVLDAPPELLPNRRLLSGALDDRLGIYAGLEVLRRVAADPPEWDVALVVTVQEENNHGGARVTAQRLAPDVAIVIEVTYAGDAPGFASWGGEVKLGGGPTVFRGPVVSPVVGDALLELAARDGITVAIETGKATHTDADDVFVAGDGIAAGIICVPIRYMHTAGEIAQLSDVDDASRLIEAYARSLTAETSFLR
jgi:putative aminopeptidase FrvX